MLIRSAELESGALADVRIADGRVVAIGTLTAREAEPVIHAKGGLLLPGLHDHHIHLAALAAAAALVLVGVNGEIIAAASYDDGGDADFVGVHRSVDNGAGWTRATTPRARRPSRC